MGLSDEIARLSDLYERGELSDDEFEAAKARLLSANQAPPPAVSAPTYVVSPGAPPFPKPSMNLVGAILATLLCCLPLGVVAIVYASQVDSKWAAGDWYGAQQASRNARNWANASLAAGLVGIVLYGIAMASGGGR